MTFVARRLREVSGEAQRARRAPSALASSVSETIDIAFESSPFGMSLTSAETPSLGRFIAANGAYCALTGYTPVQLRGMRLQDVCHPEHVPGTLAAAEELLAGTKAAVDTTARLVRADGTLVWVRQHRTLTRDSSGRPLHFFTHTEDVTERRSSDAALVEAQGRFRSAFDNAPIGMTISSADPSKGDRYMQVNRAFCEMTGYSEEQLMQRSFLDITHADDRVANSDLWRSLLAGDIERYQLEKRYVRADGEIVWVLVNTSLSYDAAGRPLHKITQIVDVSDRKRYELQLGHLANHDSLTGLRNRRAFEADLEQQIVLGRRHGTKIAVALIDLDNFKYVNDTLGHAAGDELLCRIAKILGQRCRETDVLARLGGDEFAVILREAGPEEANAVADDLRCAIYDDTLVGAMRSLHVSASIGVAVVDVGQHASAQDVLVAADIAMYDAKKAGRNRVSFSLSLTEPKARMQARFTWVERIREALLHDRFVLYAQPTLNLTSGLVDRHEILVRMVGEDGEIIPPKDFLPTAERFGLIQNIDKWVIRSTIAALRKAADSGHDLCLSVNISGSSITDAGVSAFIEGELLAEPRIATGSLIFEITETAAIVDVDEAKRVADRFCALGCSFWLDDFGAGFNSFFYLKHIPFEMVKIDGSFIENLSHSESDRLMVDAMVTVCRGLGKQTVAEFVHDEATLVSVRAAGVGFAQGYHVGVPRPLAEAGLDRRSLS